MKKKKDKGSVTLEAAIFLSMFLFAYLFFMDLVQVVRAQMILQYTVTETAKELSQYTYLLSKTGVVDQGISTGKRSAEFDNKTTEMIESVQKLGEMIVNFGDVFGQASATQQTVSSYFSDWEALKEGLISKGKTEIRAALQGILIETLCENALRGQIENMSTKDVDTYLRDLGIEGGMSDITFDGTSWFRTDRTLDIIMTYKLRFRLGVLGDQERIFKVRAKTAVW